MEKIVLASCISPISICEEKEGVVRVKSQGSGTEAGYIVQLNTNGMPSCQWHDWKQNFLRCKHMFAIILHMQKYSWEGLPAAYRDAPNFTLDCAIYSVETPTDDSNLDIVTIDEIKGEEADRSTPVPICEMKALPLPHTLAKRPLGAICSDKVYQLKGLTLNITDQKAMTVEKCPLCRGTYHKKCEAGKKRFKIIRNGITRWFCSKCTDQCNIRATYEIKDKDALSSTITILSEN